MIMSKKTKQFAQLWDNGVKSGIIAEIRYRNFLLLAALSSFMNKNGECHPKLKTIAKILGITEETAKKWVAKAKKQNYKGEPIISANQDKKVVKGKILWSSNRYKISESIREDLIGRYKSVGKNLPAEESKKNLDKTNFPSSNFPTTEKRPTNNNQLNKEEFNINEKEESLINKIPLNTNKDSKKITLEEFEKTITNEDNRQNREKARCLEIARWLNEPYINFILSCLYSETCGLTGIEWAYSGTKNDFLEGRIKISKARRFNSYTKIYKKKINMP